VTKQYWLGIISVVIPLLWLSPCVSATPPTLTHGVMSGEVTATGANIWTRTSQEGVVEVEYDTTKEFHHPHSGGRMSVSAENDFTGVVSLTGLHPETRYYYRVRTTDSDLAYSLSGSFLTAPLSDRPGQVTFLWGGDLGGQGFCRQPAYAIFDILRAQAADFFLFAGDTIYADSRCPSPPNTPGADFKATTQEQFWAKYKYQREDRALRDFLAQTSVYAIWDDHEVTGDFAGPSEPLMPLGFQAFWNYFPFSAVDRQDRRLYRSFRWGKHIELFILDTRQYRSPNLQSDGPGKTMLGAMQLKWLLEGLASSTATWQCIVSSVPLAARTGNPTRGHDSWAGGSFPGGFENELEKIVTALQRAHKRNVIWLSADIHMARAFAYDPDQDGAVDFHEFVSGPLSAISGDFGPLSDKFHPRLLYEETKFFNFGKIRIDGATGTFTVEIRDQEGKVHYSLTLPAAGAAH
jgi:alkaline phosphatase D